MLVPNRNLDCLFSSKSNQNHAGNNDKHAQDLLPAQRTFKIQSHCQLNC